MIPRWATAKVTLPYQRHKKGKNCKTPYSSLLPLTVSSITLSDSVPFVLQESDLVHVDFLVVVASVAVFVKLDVVVNAFVAVTVWRRLEVSILRFGGNSRDMEDLCSASGELKGNKLPQRIPTGNQKDRLHESGTKR
jgi:hypothetical protein